MAVQICRHALHVGLCVGIQYLCFPAPKVPTKPINQSYISKTWVRVRPDKDARIHGFRRTIATYILLDGTIADMNTVSSLLGHKDISTTARHYTQVPRERTVLAAERHQKRIKAGETNPSKYS